MHGYLKFPNKERRAAFMTSAELQALNVRNIIEHDNSTEKNIEFRVSYRSASEVQHQQLIELGKAYEAKTYQYLASDQSRYNHGYYKYD